ncbi:MAG: chalcone isomerase family protein [Candidatus Cloacimonetes bacterium]|nr:chalcone isomerase family protein [Candidatus Cloacimonadota bacterium]
MKKMIMMVLLIALILPLAALKVGGVDLPDKLTLGEENLVLNGAGVRTKVIIKVYAGGLYLPAKSDNAANILSEESAISVRMHFIYKEVDEAKLIEAWNEGFVNGGFEAKFAVEIARFNKLFKAPAKKGDIYDIAYLPGTGVQVIKNNVVIGTIENPAFRKAVFSIWLGEKTALPGLKKDMLGN